MRPLAISLAILLMAASAHAQKKSYPIFRALDQKSVETMVLGVPQSNPLRLAQLKRAFEDVECTGANLHEQSTSQGSNLLCSLPGKSTDTVLISAHYRHVGEGMSAVDDWSGSIMLPLLYRALTATPRQQTYIFAALSGDDAAKVFLASLTPAQRRSIKAIIALDALGLGPMRFYIHLSGTVPTPAENSLRVQLFEAADNQGLKPPESSIPGSWFHVDDTKEFRYHGIPAILMHSVDGSKRHVPGSRDDNAEAIDANDYFASYMTLCYYLVGLDQVSAWSALPSAPSPRRGGRR
jgi:Zn-dependent M28 family amino/carboxypeptidase